jgi:hypothetical protein
VGLLNLKKDEAEENSGRKQIMTPRPSRLHMSMRCREIDAKDAATASKRRLTFDV